MHPDIPPILRRRGRPSGRMDQLDLYRVLRFCTSAFGALHDNPFTRIFKPRRHQSLGRPPEELEPRSDVGHVEPGSGLLGRDPSLLEQFFGWVYFNGYAR
jgi:hypothetical protein